MPNPAPSSAAQQLAARLAQPQPMRRGSLSERFVRCGKPGCRCATDPAARHGPYFSLTRALQGQTHSRFLTPQQAQIVGRQIAAGHAFRRHVDAYWKICEQWAEEELEGSSTAAAEAVKKGGFRPASKRKSPNKSSA